MKTKNTQTLRLYIETPSGERYEADIPCEATVGQVAGDFFEAQGWSTKDARGRGQRAVVELVDPGNPDNSKRLSSDKGICESGLRNGDTLRIVPESSSGDGTPPPVFDEVGMWLHASVKNHRIFRNHKELIWQVAWSPDGKMLASTSIDKAIRFWQADTGQLFRVLPTGHQSAITSIAWSPDSKILASASTDEKIYLWNVGVGQFLAALTGGDGAMTCMAWSPDGKILASASTNEEIYFWDVENKQLLHIFIAHQDAVNCIAWSPDGKILASASTDKTLRLWNGENKQLLHIFTGHQDAVNSIAWSPDGKILASSGEDNTIRIWNFDPERQRHILEGFAGSIGPISFSFDGRFLASKSHDGTIRLWRSDIWEEIILVREEPLYAKGSSYTKRSPSSWPSFFAFHPQALVMATPGEENTAIYVLDLNLDTLLTSNIASSANYANAKIVLLGESGVGKTGLSLVLTAKSFIPTESTHGRHVWVFDNTEAPLGTTHTETRETFLWDLAGQPGYRLTHQLHLSEAVVALIVFDARNEEDPFAGVHYWNRALSQAQRINDTPLPLKKFLVAARMDRGGIGVSRKRIESLVNELGFDGYFETSAKEGRNINKLRQTIREAIDWSMLPKITSTRLFRQIRDFLIAKKNAGYLLDFMHNLYYDFLHSELDGNDELDTLQERFENCITLMARQGLIRKFRINNSVLLQPELLDIYASALINAMKDEPDSQGIINERDVKEAKFFIPTDQRLKDKGQERDLLNLMVEDLLGQEIVLREPLEGKMHLIFPSQSSREFDNLSYMGEKKVVFSFEGPILNIYTRLAVRLSHSGVFRRKEVWKNAATYTTAAGGTYGILLENTGEGKGSLTLFFETASEEMKFHFEDFVYEHLTRSVPLKFIDRQRIFSCDVCTIPLSNQTVQERLKRKFDWLYCPVCDAVVSLLDGKERIKGVNSSLISKMNRSADQGRESDITAFVFQTIQEVRMTQGDDIKIYTGNISNTGGQQTLGKAENVTANITNSQQDQREIVQALQALMNAILASKELPDAEKQEHVAVITQVSEEVVKPQPNKVLLKMFGSGFLTVLKMIPDLTNAVNDVIPLLNKVHL